MYCPAKLPSNLMDTNGPPSQLEGETIHQYMRRLYHVPMNRGITAVKSPNDNTIKKHQRWAFRPPSQLAEMAEEFIQENEMTVTSYLTYCMHKLHINQKSK